MANILLIPGLGCTAELFAPQISALSGTHQITVGDHGCGGSIQEVAKQILANAPARFAIGGLSMGGMLAMELLRQAPERVSKAVLLNTTARAELPERKHVRAAVMRTAREMGMDKVFEETFPFWVHEDSRNDEQLQIIAQRMLSDTGVDRFIRQCEALIERPDWRSDLPDMKNPTLVIVGDGDALTPPKLAEEIFQLLPNAHKKVIRQCGHISTLERPDEVNALLLDFFADA